MRYVFMHYETEATEAGEMPTPEQQQAIGQFMQEIASSGVLLSGEGVFPSSHGARLEFADGNVRVIDGPFAEARELIADSRLTCPKEWCPSGPRPPGRVPNEHGASTTHQSYKSHQHQVTM